MITKKPILTRFSEIDFCEYIKFDSKLFAGISFTSNP